VTLAASPTALRAGGRVMLDATPLGRLARPKPRPDDERRLRSLLVSGVEVFVPEVTDFEVRRNLLLHNLLPSIRELDRLKATLIYAPISTPVMLRAAELWADARRRGHPTADPRELDCDVVLAAQALDVGAAVLTENISHLSRYVTALDWRTVAPPPPMPPSP
jgi:predicted nucleic acid-binding protein